jgi:phage-related protein
MQDKNNVNRLGGVVKATRQAMKLTQSQLHYFMKKSNKTPQREIDTARRRLEEARKEPERYESE